MRKFEYSSEHLEGTVECGYIDIQGQYVCFCTDIDRLYGPDTQCVLILRNPDWVREICNETQQSD